MRSMRTNMVLNVMLMETSRYVTPVIKYYRCQNMRSISPTSARSRWPSARSALRSFQAACCPTTWTGARWRCVIRALLLASSASSRWKRKSWRIMPSPIWSTKKWWSASLSRVLPNRTSFLRMRSLIRRKAWAKRQFWPKKIWMICLAAISKWPIVMTMKMSSLSAPCARQTLRTVSASVPCAASTCSTKIALTDGWLLKMDLVPFARLFKSQMNVTRHQLRELSEEPTRRCRRCGSTPHPRWRYPIAGRIIQRVIVTVATEAVKINELPPTHWQITAIEYWMMTKCKINWFSNSIVLISINNLPDKINTIYINWKAK